MSSPAKRRKKNDHGKAIASPGRNLDFFFAKQRGADAPSATAQTVAQTANVSAELQALTSSNDIAVPGPQASSQLSSDAGAGLSDAVLTDEEVARRLHEELNGVDGEGGNATDRGEVGEGSGASSALAQVAYQEPTISSRLGAQDQNLVDNLYSIDDIEKPNHHAISKLPLATKKETLSLQSTVAEQDKKSTEIPFDEFCLTFDPQKYISDLRREWDALGGNATYALLVQCFTLVSGTQSRIKIVNILVNFVRTLIEGDPESLLPAVCWTNE